MAEYQLTVDNRVILRTEDSVRIPDDPANRDYAEYLAWVEDGGVPDPYVAPETSPPEATSGQTIAYDHENRIRALEGQPPLALGDFVDKMRP